MTRLLDANVFITAKNLYYAFDVVPAFWDWLDEQAADGSVASTDMIYDELKDGGDDLAEWVKARRETLFHVDSTSKIVTDVFPGIGRWMADVGFPERAQAQFMSGADPFLAAVAQVNGDVVVTLEEFDAQCRRKVPLPNLCRHLEITHETTFEMLRSLGARFGQ